MSIAPFTNSFYAFRQSVNDYIFFSPQTTGTNSGRAVKIRKDLFLAFFCAIDPDTYDGQVVIRQIENLRTTSTLALEETGSDYANNPRQTADHKMRIDRLKGVSRHSLAVKNLRVSYRISQQGSDRSPTIYIDEIKTKNEADTNQAGLYQASAGIAVKGAKKIEDKDLTAKSVYINGVERSLSNALQSAAKTLGESNATLFYNPSEATDDLDLWGASSKTYTTQFAIEKLAKVLKDNQGNTITWHAEGVGAALLTEALGKVTVELSKHEFRLINPIANTVNLVQAINSKKAKLTDKSFTYENNTASLLSLLANKDRIKAAAGKYIDSKHKNYDAIKCNLIAKHLETSISMKSPTQAANLNQAGQTFVQVLQKARIYRQ